MFVKKKKIQVKDGKNIANQMSFFLFFLQKNKNEIKEKYILAL